MGSASSAAARRRTTRTSRKEKRSRVASAGRLPLAVRATRRTTPAPKSLAPNSLATKPAAPASAARSIPAAVAASPSLRALAVAAELSITPATAGDHVQLPLLWTAAAAGPSRAEYQATVDDPDYLPGQRMLAKRGHTVVGQVQIEITPVRFAGCWLPTGKLRHLVVLPEFRGAGVEGKLLAAAEARLRAAGSPLALARDVAPENFLARGWGPFSATSATVAKPRDLLAALVSARSPATNVVGSAAPAYQVRLWRQVELEGLIRLYGAPGETTSGAGERTRSVWRRLIQRRAYDRIYVALEGRDCRVDSLEASHHLAGYAVVSRQRIVELVGDSRHPDARRQLLARACGDAIEHGWHEVRLDAPAGDPLHALFLQAGGQAIAGARDGGSTSLAKVVDFAELVKTIGPTLAGRLQAARAPLPCRIGVEIAGHWQVLEITRGAASLTKGRALRTSFSASEAMLTRLLLGQLSLEAAIERKELRVSGPLVRKLLAVLFPRQGWWLPAWEDLEA